MICDCPPPPRTHALTRPPPERPVLPISASTVHLTTRINQFLAAGHLSEHQLRQWQALSRTTWPEARADPGAVLYTTRDQANQQKNATAPAHAAGAHHARPPPSAHPHDLGSPRSLTAPPSSTATPATSRQPGAAP
ncbi:hypothetical protein ACF1BP_22120 [Streptomyces sp. NPDC014735]|uniref:hypothetical protein n=1 Tax=Streptomyces sp. NPDC014735 TaxID=3364887 RepID=UPI0036F97883